MSWTVRWTAALAKTASVTEGAPTGAARNSWMSVASAACSPPPTTFPSGMGKFSPRNVPPRCW
jgi:hypothetical protein